MQELRSQHQFLKIISLKTHSTSFPGAQRASFSSLHFLRVCRKSTAVAAQDSTSGEAEGRCPQQVPILADTLICKLYYLSLYTQPLVLPELTIAFVFADYVLWSSHEFSSNDCSACMTFSRSGDTLDISSVFPSLEMSSWTLLTCSHLVWILLHLEHSHPPRISLHHHLGSTLKCCEYCIAQGTLPSTL